MVPKEKNVFSFHCRTPSLCGPIGLNFFMPRVVKALMKFGILIFLLIFVSCVKKEMNSIVLPANQATAEESEILSAALVKIQSDFDEAGVRVKLRSIPYRVATLERSVAGYCMYRGDGSPVGIVINKNVFRDWETETPTHYGLIYKVLLHEIGHCFFHRAHDDDIFEIPWGLLFLKGPDDEFHNEEYIELSAMKDGGKAQIARSLWPYYIREVAGLDRLNSLEDLLAYAEIDIRPL